MRVLVMLSALLVASLAGCADVPGPEPVQDQEEPMDRNQDGVVVVAVIDSGFDPYHFDFVAAQMPQHLDNDTANDLPLSTSPAQWLPNHPGADAFSSFIELPINLSTDPNASPGQLYNEDSETWQQVKRSSRDDVHMHWIPGTKVVGYVNMGGGTGFAASSHGVGATSVSVGNIHGTCPECLLVFVNGFSEAAVDWVSKQDWIDLQTNSWGASTTLWDKIYSGCDNPLHREGVERGQQLFFSGSNGQANAFFVPTSTLHSCQKGPDWIVTVGAVAPGSETSYSGHGKPVDVSSFGSGYPSAGGSTVTADSTFSGTSNAAPVTAGTYARALWTLRQQFGTSAMQDNGTIAVGPAGCGEANPDCAMADGNLTVHELRQALLRAAIPTGEGVAVGITGVPVPVEAADTPWFQQGHGTYFGRMYGDQVHQEETARIVSWVLGETFEEQSADEADYFEAYSYCSQQVWGTWAFGDWDPASPAPSPKPGSPAQSFLAGPCATVFQAITEP